MILFYTIRVHFGAWLAIIALGILGAILGDGNFRAIFEGPVFNAAIVLLVIAWSGSWVWLLIYSWIMLLRCWKVRSLGENLRLFLILFFFNLLGAYYFYWKRYEIDPKVI